MIGKIIWDIGSQNWSADDWRIDIMAFQDGMVPQGELADYLSAAQEFSSDLGIELWNNVETFQRGLSYDFPPRDIRVLTKRLKIAEPFVTKHITFEFSHFMSPNSTGAPNLYRRYCETVLGEKYGPRVGWAEAFQLIAENVDDKLIDE